MTDAVDQEGGVCWLDPEVGSADLSSTQAAELH